MSRDWDDLRQDFPGTKERVYLNAAAGSITPRWVREAVSRYLLELEEGGDDHWDLWLAQMEVVRERVARFIGAQADEIAFVTNTSEGMNILADLVSHDGPILSDELEFPTVTLPFVHRGAQLQFIPAIEGELRLEMFDEVHAPRASTIAVSHVQFSNGYRLDLEALAELKGRRSLIVCGSQSLGAFEIDVNAMQIDGMACAGHKWLCAGYGAGFVYVSKELLTRAPKGLGWRSVKDPFAFNNRAGVPVKAARRYEMGCPAFPGIFALGAAVSYLDGIGRDRIQSRVLQLNTVLTSAMRHEGFEVLSPSGSGRSGQTLIAMDDPGAVTEFLRGEGILVTQKHQGIRVSTHFYNNDDDIAKFVEALKKYRDGAANPSA
ncbi:MAG: aminotransferase class V-fold PLP-dependent enzyme [Vicinamibacteria bacterium]|jgi:cysteine desulfurase/selenocysteine lyase|nr:aminotransferase class V-fold PLP-dependent enzyme [Vicinamibacteria bacterium]